MVYSGFHAVSSHLQGYFKNLLGPSSTTRIPVDPSIISLGNTLPVDMQHLLCAPFTDTDIRDAIFSIPVLKSPGPDGFGSGFFKATWHITGPLVCLRFIIFFVPLSYPRNSGAQSFASSQRPRHQPRPKILDQSPAAPSSTRVLPNYFAVASRSLFHISYINHRVPSWRAGNYFSTSSSARI